MWVWGGGGTRQGQAVEQKPGNFGKVVCVQRINRVAKVGTKAKCTGYGWTEELNGLVIVRQRG